MPDKKPLSVLVDTSFLINVYTEGAEHHEVAKKYYKYFLKHNIKMHLSTIVVSEFHQKQTIVELLKTGQYIVEPYNVDDAVVTADLTFKLGNSERRGDAKAEFKDDLKLMGQAENKDITFIITGDENTLARYCKTLSDLSLFKPEVIILSDGFSATHFNNGQSALIDEDV